MIHLRVAPPACLGLLLLLGACNGTEVPDRIPFDLDLGLGGNGDGDGDGDEGEDEGPRPVDVLFVVDNSGSMCEEQQNLKDNFYDPDCPLTDLNDIPEEYRDPDEETLDELAQSCGFVQLLAALEVDARLGVISTDVGDCDNRFGLDSIPDHPNHCSDVVGDWGRRPQRGCLQAPPGADRRFVEIGDPALVERFNGFVDALGTYGSAFERGFDATRAFLEEDAVPDCEGHAETFLRDGADLTLVYLSDEDDCSHPVSAEFPDEEVGNTCEEFELNHDVNANLCYDAPELLTPVDEFADWLRDWGQGRGKTVRVSSVVGATYVEGQDALQPVGCLIDENGKPDGQCTESQGASNLTQSGMFCDPDTLDDEGLPPCCAADPGTRYLELSQGLSSDGYVDSICYASFRNTLLEVAELAASR